MGSPPDQIRSMEGRDLGAISQPTHPLVCHAAMVLGSNKKRPQPTSWCRESGEGPHHPAPDGDPRAVKSEALESSGSREALSAASADALHPWTLNGPIELSIHLSWLTYLTGACIS